MKPTTWVRCSWLLLKPAYQGYTQTTTHPNFVVWTVLSRNTNSTNTRADVHRGDLDGALPMSASRLRRLCHLLSANCTPLETNLKLPCKPSRDPSDMDPQTAPVSAFDPKNRVRDNLRVPACLFACVCVCETVQFRSCPLSPTNPWTGKLD